MPYNATKSASYGSKSVLRFAAPVGTPRRNVVLDATDGKAFASPTDGSRFFAPAGTILVKSTRAGKVTAIGGSNDSGSRTSSPIVGILIENVDLLANATEDDEPFGAFYKLVSFATEKIVGYTAHITELASALPTCSFE